MGNHLRGENPVSIPSDRVLVSILFKNDRSEDIGLNPLRSGLGFNGDGMATIKVNGIEIVSIPSDRVLVSMVATYDPRLGGAVVVGLNPLRSGLGFNIRRMKNEKRKNEKSLNPLRSGLGFNRIKRLQKALSRSLNPLRSGLGFNPALRRELFMKLSAESVSIPSDRVLVSIILISKKI